VQVCHGKGLRLRVHTDLRVSKDRKATASAPLPSEQDLLFSDY